MRYASLMAEPTPQTQAVSEKQVKNSAGGYTFKLDKWGRLDRFLILGSDAPTYYADARSLTVENAKSVRECALEDAERTVNKIVEVSTSGRSHNNDAAIFALAVVATSKNANARYIAFNALSSVARTASHHFAFHASLDSLGDKWNRSRRNVTERWYSSLTDDQVAYQALKYRNRNDFSHKDLLRLAHVTPETERRSDLYRYLVKGETSPVLPDIVYRYEQLQKAETVQEAISIVKDGKLTWEFVPDRFLSSAEMWKALLPNLPMTAMIRNLGKMTSLDMLKPLSKDASYVISKIEDSETCAKARLHPLNLLIARRTYVSGKGFRGSLSWTPNVAIGAALDKAFYNSFKSMESTGKRILWAQDVSGSMGTEIAGKNITCAEAGAALALTMLNVEKNVHVVGFADTLVDLGIAKTDDIRTATTKAHMRNFGATDCAAPMYYALNKGLDVDLFVVCTDNETYAGYIHPHEALNRYRNSTGIDAKLVVIGMTATDFTIADPDDPGMLDVVGFDPNLYSIIGDFAKGAW